MFKSLLGLFYSKVWLRSTHYARSRKAYYTLYATYSWYVLIVFLPLESCLENTNISKTGTIQPKLELYNSLRENVKLEEAIDGKLGADNKFLDKDVSNFSKTNKLENVEEKTIHTEKDNTLVSSSKSRFKLIEKVFF